MKLRWVVSSVLLAALGSSLLAGPPARALAPYDTWIELDSVSTPVTYGDQLTISGQVVYYDPDDDDEYAVSDAEVTLEKRALGAASWTYVGTDVATGFWPWFEFGQTARRNTQYRVTYAGDETYGPSQDTVSVTVHRKVTANLVEPRHNVFYLKGRVVPSYAGRRVALLRRTCSSCRWREYGAQRATSTSTYRFRLPLPRSGTFYFRAMVAKDAGFLKSFSRIGSLTRIF